MVNRPPATRLQCSLCHLVKSSSPHRRKEELSRSTTVHLSHYQYYKHHILNQSKLFITPLLCTASLQLSRDADVKFYTGFSDTTQFKCIFDQLLPKAKKMQCWRGTKQTDQETPSAAISADFTHAYARPGSSRKLRLEQELLLVMMRLRVGLTVDVEIWNLSARSCTIHT